MPAIVALLILWFIGAWLYKSHPFVLFLIVVAFVFLAVLLISNSREAARKKKELRNEWRREEEERRAEDQKWKRQAWDEACSMTDYHLPALAKKFSQTTYIDDYGNQITDRWAAEVKYFIENVVAKSQKLKELVLDDEMSLNQLVEEIDRRTRVYSESNKASLQLGDMTSLDYEAYIKGLLEENGWDATLTVASGDQGIDIKGTLHGVKAVFQCKKYSQPVGNSAVQEIIAGREFEKAQLAAVVSNAGYTTSAKQLAGSANVHLLHHSEIQAFTSHVLQAFLQSSEPALEAPTD